MTRIILRLDNTSLWPVASDLKYHNNVSEKNIEETIKEILQNVLGKDMTTIEEFDRFLDENNKQIKLSEDNYYSYSHVLRSTDAELYQRMFEDWLEQYLNSDL